jgi:hypothetical protein
VNGDGARDFVIDVDPAAWPAHGDPRHPFLNNPFAMAMSM